MYCAIAERSLSPLSCARREIVRRVPQIVHPAAEKFRRAALSRSRAPVSGPSPGALTCIMRYRTTRGSLAECFLLPGERQTRSRQRYSLRYYVRVARGDGGAGNSGEQVLRKACVQLVASRFTRRYMQAPRIMFTCNVRSRVNAALLTITRSSLGR